MNDLQLFDISDARARFGTTEDGTPYAVAADYAKAFGYRDAHDALRLLDDEEKGTQIVRTPGGPQRMSVIYEDGLWELMFRSTLPGAKAVKKQVKNILREIRKTGQYIPAEQPKPSGSLMWRVQEKGNYKAIRNIMALATDYDPASEESRQNFRRLQNLLYAQISGLDAEGLRTIREINMAALESTRKDGKPYASDIKVAKNYLTETELEKLDALTLAVLSHAKMLLIERDSYTTADLFKAVYFELDTSRKIRALVERSHR